MRSKVASRNYYNRTCNRIPRHKFNNSDDPILQMMYKMVGERLEIISLRSLESPDLDFDNQWVISI